MFQIKNLKIFLFIILFNICFSQSLYESVEDLEINWEDKCLSPHKNKRIVTTASNSQIRKKVYVDSSQNWKKFKPFLNGKLDKLDY